MSLKERHSFLKRVNKLSGSRSKANTTNGSDAHGNTNARAEAFAADIARAHPTPHALAAAGQSLREKLVISRCFAEYTALEELQDELNHTYGFKTALKATEADLNRYSDVLPYEHSRIKVHGTAQVQLGTEVDDYMNASLIECSDPVTGSAWQYIAAQGPLPQTADAFWQMVVEQKARSIVMLTDLIENKRRKCHPYFALKAGSTFKAGPTVQVRTVSTDELIPGLIRRQFEVFLNDSVDPWRCEHYHYTAWPDHGVPQSPTTILVLCSLMRNNPPQMIDGREPPIVVHCSAGIGRTGVFCTVDIASRLLLTAGKAAEGSNGDESSANLVANAAREAVDVGKIVAQLRHQRGGMVQTGEQFKFCHTALLALIEEAMDLIKLMGV